MSRFAPLLLLVLFGACSGSERTAGEKSTSAQESGAQPGAWIKGGAWRISRISQIGAHDGPAAFGRISGVAIDGFGRIWVADAQQHQVRIFAEDGTPVRSFGSKGAGPAEFNGIAGMDWDADGNLWVLDAGNSRFAVYDTAGRLLRTIPRTAAVSGSPWPGGFDAQGRLIDYGSLTRRGNTVHATLVRLGTDGGVTDTFSMPPYEEQMFGAIRSGDSRNSRVTQAPVPFTGQPLWAVDPEGYVWYAMSDSYRIERRRFDGRLDRVVQMESRAPRVSREDRDRVLANYRWFEEQGGKIDGSKIPDEHPDLLNFFFDDAGHLLVIPTATGAAGTRLDVFEVSGRYLGEIRTPTRIVSRPVPVVRGDRLVGVTADGDGVQSIVVFRITRPPRGERS